MNSDRVTMRRSKAGKGMKEQRVRNEQVGWTVYLIPGHKKSTIIETSCRHAEVII